MKTFKSLLKSYTLRRPNSTVISSISCRRYALLLAKGIVFFLTIGDISRYRPFTSSKIIHVEDG